MVSAFIFGEDTSREEEVWVAVKLWRKSKDSTIVIIVILLVDKLDDCRYQIDLLYAKAALSENLRYMYAS